LRLTKSNAALLPHFAKGTSFNEIINGVRYGINSARIESAHAGIDHICPKDFFSGAEASMSTGVSHEELSEATPA